MQGVPMQIFALHNITRYDASIKKGIDWLRFVQRENDNHADVKALEALYKVPMSFASVGMITEGQHLLHYIVDNYLTNDGHFQEEIVKLYSHRYCDLYQDLWLAWGAYKLNEFNVAQKCMAFVLRFFSEANGGFFSRIAAESPNTTYELRSTALGGIVNLDMKNVCIAEKTGDFVIKILDLQPDISKGFYLAQDIKGNLITNFDVKDERYFIITRDQDQPLYYALGLAISLLAYLFLMTKKPKYLSAAERYFSVCVGYGDSIYQHHYSGKLGWGLAILYHVTKKEVYARLAIKIADFITNLQLSDGKWHLTTLFPDFNDQPIAITIDRTSEYVVWLTNIVHELTE